MSLPSGRRQRTFQRAPGLVLVIAQVPWNTPCRPAYGRGRTRRAAAVRSRQREYSTCGVQNPPARRASPMRRMHCMDATICVRVLRGEEIMDRSIERRVTRRSRAVRPRWDTCPVARHGGDGDLHLQDTTGELDFAPAHGCLHPALRAPRAVAGFFCRRLKLRRRQSAWRKADKSIIGLAVAVVAIASALIVGAPTAIMGAAVNVNPGPAIVGAASVPPAFIEVPTAH